MNTEILVIEDDDLVRQGIVDILELKGWNAVAAKSCSEALVRIRGEEYMLYVLDMKLPDGNGIMLCREIRRYTDNPILFLSAYDSEEFIVEGFEAGANDYVIKPFRTFEFVARIKALLRRTGMQNGKKVKKGIKSGEYELDLQKQILQKDGVRIALTRTEYQILCSLLANAPNLVTREFLLDTIWDNVCMPLYIAHTVPDKAYIRQLLEKVGLWDRNGDYPDQLSGGEQQRVAIARAMAAKPGVILADEPTGNLDYQTGQEIMKLICASRELYRQTIVMVTHDMDSANYADRIVYMEDGALR